MAMKKYILLVVACLLPAAATYARQFKGKINVITKEATQRGDSIYIDMDILLEGIAMNSERSMTLTPMLVAEGRNRALPSVVINGHARQRLFDRALRLNKKAPHNYYKVVESKNREEKTGSYVRTLSYKVAIPYEEWMYNARMEMDEELCGCGGYEQQVSVVPLVNQLAHEVIVKEQPQLSVGEYTVHPLMTYIRPQVETVKQRNDSYEVNLNFPVAKSVIDPAFGNNRGELNRIEELINKLRDDKNLHVTGVTVRGMASLEGSQALNDRLSSARAQALLSYLSSRLSWLSGRCEVLHGGEDWEMMEDAVDSDLVPATYRSDLQRIIDLRRTADQKEALIKQLDGGRAYRWLLDNIFPRMRRVICVANYVVKAFTPDEAKQAYARDPRLLSLEEMYGVANTYDTTDPRFGEVFETAARLFPDNETANLNAAASLLQWGNAERALNYLKKVDPSTQGYANNMGVYHLLQGNYQEAGEWLNRADALGDRQAAHNQKELEQKLKSLQQ